MPNALSKSLPIVIGVLAALAAALIGAGWQVATRWGVTTTLAPIDLCLLRYCGPALLLLPILIRQGFALKTPPLLLAGMIAGAGLPFGLIVITGAQFAPVAHMGALLPGSMPLFVALLAALAFGEKLSPLKLCGFAVIIIGVALVTAPAFAQAQTGQWRGHLLFLSASFLWAVFTIAFRKSGLGPWHASALVSFWSAVAVIPTWLLLSSASRLASAPMRDIAIQAIVQGAIAGVGGLAAYAIAIRYLGAQRASLSGALVPALSAVGGAALIGEQPTAMTIAGVSLTTLGVALASLANARR